MDADATLSQSDAPPSVQRIVGLLPKGSQSGLDAKLRFAAAYVDGLRNKSELARIAGVSREAVRRWVVMIEEAGPSEEPLTPEAKRAMLSRIATDDRAPGNIRLSALDLDNKMAGDYAPQQVQQVTVHMVLGDGGRPAIEAKLRERLERLGLDPVALGGKGKPPPRLGDGGEGDA